MDYSKLSKEELEARMGDHLDFSCPPEELEAERKSAQKAKKKPAQTKERIHFYLTDNDVLCFKKLVFAYNLVNKTNYSASRLVRELFEKEYENNEEVRKAYEKLLKI